jgi:hypothetical protein
MSITIAKKFTQHNIILFSRRHHSPGVQTTNNISVDVEPLKI